MKYQIIITYKNGSTIILDVPDNYYQEKYSKKSDTAIHKIFMKEYKNFVDAMNKSENMVNVNKYLSFSKATVSALNVLGIDLKTVCETPNTNDDTNISVPGVHDKTYLDISETSLDVILKKLESTNLIENLDKFIQNIGLIVDKIAFELNSSNSNNNKVESKKKSTTTTTVASNTKKSKATTSQDAIVKNNNNDDDGVKTSDLLQTSSTKKDKKEITINDNNENNNDVKEV